MVNFIVELGNLLAVIHRDGGHYQGYFGTKEAITDAGKIVVDTRAQLHESTFVLKQLLNLIDKNSHTEAVIAKVEALLARLDAADKPRIEVCSNCKGKGEICDLGTPYDSGWRVCPSCNGDGFIPKKIT